jgi:hypothetical protein
VRTQTWDMGHGRVLIEDTNMGHGRVGHGRAGTCLEQPHFETLGSF